jgi:hypothetical protein
LALFREKPDSAVLFFNPDDVTENLDTSAFTFDYKAGIYGNDCGQDSFLDTGGVVDPAADNAGSAAFVGEAHLVANVRLCGNLSLRGSYGVLGTSSLALATDQMAVTDFVVGTGIHDTGNAFYHGGFLGLDFGY